LTLPAPNGDVALSYPLVRARGSHFELGRQHGEQCRKQISGFVEYLQTTLGISNGELANRCRRFLPLFEEHCPHLVQEIHGLAQGANVRFEEAFAPQIRGELAGVQNEACTTFVIAARATATACPLIGQNCDMEPQLEQFGYVLHLEPDGKPPLIMWTFGGQIGYHGMNQDGVAHFANALGGGPNWRWGLPHYPVKRMMLEMSTLPEIFALLQRSRVCSNGNYVLCDADRIADVEVTPDGFEVVPDHDQGFILHTNHFLCGTQACQKNFDQSLSDSFPRLERMRQQVSGKFGSLTVQDFKKFLADHSGFPTSICRHPHDGPDHPSVSARGRTVTSIIAEPVTGRFHVAQGNPCTTDYATYQLG
jgi:isopenicillin-N N-acyltransferase like protein